MTDNDYTPAAPGDFFCPSGGAWYACQAGSKFIGCCTSDPCGTGCFGDRLRPAGFSTKVYSKSPGASCGGSTPDWTCTAAPTFWGCCNSNPCKKNSTCAVGDLEPAVMSRPDQYEYFGALNVLLSSTQPSVTSSPSVSATASQTPTLSKSGSSSKVSGTVIGGAIAGALAFLIILGVVILFLLRRKRRKHNLAVRQAGAQDTVAVAQKEGSHTVAFSPQFSGHSPPPTYAYDHRAFSEIPQEISADTTNTGGANRYSELPAQTAAHRFSELPAGATKPRELESPEVSPMPAQTEFTSSKTTGPTQALGIMGAGQDIKH